MTATRAVSPDQAAAHSVKRGSVTLGVAAWAMARSACAPAARRAATVTPPRPRSADRRDRPVEDGGVDVRWDVITVMAFPSWEDLCLPPGEGSDRLSCRMAPLS